MYKKILLHFFGVNESFLYSAKVAFRVFVVAFAVVSLIAIFTYISDGVVGLNKYIFEAVDYKSLANIVITVFFVLTILIPIAIAIIRFLTSLEYCQKKKISLRLFYEKSDDEILEIWGFREKK